jgi:hypothetical protein
VDKDQDDSDDDMVKTPPEFTKDTTWIGYEKGFKNFLSTKKGVNGVLLDYIMRSNDAPAPVPPAPNAIAFANEHERLTLTTPLTGPAYEKDNGKVWTVLKSSTLKGPAWAYISNFDRTRNGRGAIRALKEHYEGPAAMSATKAAAYDLIRNASYNGEKRNWTFEQYITTFQKSHQILLEYGEPVPEAKKVRDMIDGIDHSSVLMASGIATLKAQPLLLEDFHAASNFLCNFVAANKGSTPRNISSINSNNSGRGRGGRGRGRGRGHGGGRGGRGGRGGNGKGGVDGLGNYTQAEWNKLTSEQQAEVRKKRADNLTKRKRNTSGVKSSDSKDASDSAQADQTTSTTSNAGEQFAKFKKLRVSD